MKKTNYILRTGKLTEGSHQSSAQRQFVILDVGHGNSAILRESDHVIVIDAGPKSGLQEYLLQQGISVIDLILISHADADHIGGLIGLIASKKFEIHQIHLNTDSQKGTEIWNDLLDALDKAQTTREIDVVPALIRNNRLEFPQGRVRLEILGPSLYLTLKGPGSLNKKERKITTNSISAVIRLLQDDQPIALLPGDLDEVGFDDLIEHNRDISAPLLIFPHHGGRTATTFIQKLCQRVNPQTIIFSIGRGKHQTPRPEVVQAIRQQLPQVRLACTQLSEHCAETLPNFIPDHLVNVFAQGRERGKCCAGSLVINLDQPHLVKPEQATHQLFIKENALNALCR